MTAHDPQIDFAFSTRDVTPLRNTRESKPLHAALSCHIVILLPFVSFPPLQVATLLPLGHGTAASKVAVGPVLSRLPS
jgi:hypothetical protein